MSTSARAKRSFLSKSHLAATAGSADGGCSQQEGNPAVAWPQLCQHSLIQLDLIAMALRDETCLPCLDGGGALGTDELAVLRDQLPGWEVMDGHHLHKRLSFADFATALGWLNRAGAICEQQGHHGDFRIGWGYVEIDLFTHKADGLTRADAVLAAKLDALQS